MNIVSEKPKILAVDDKPENLIVLEKLLAPLDCELYTATSGNDALKIAIEEDFALALLDVQMPGMNGYELLEMMSWDEKTRHIPVIFLTANFRDEEHKIKGYSFGAVDYLYKPISEELLLGKVRVFIDLYKEKIKHKRLQNKFESILRSANEGILGLDLEGNINFINPKAKKLLDKSDENLLNKPLSSVIFSNDTSNPSFSWKDSPLLSSCLKGENYYENDGLFVKSDKSVLPIEYTASPLLDEHEQCIGIVLIFSDITMRKTVEQQLMSLAMYDHLTKLPNRMYYEKTLEQTIARNTRTNQLMAVMFLDLDKFKFINDTLGHDVGDELLKNVALRLKSCLRQSDTVARLGGDEFAIILDPLSHYDDANLIAEKIIAEIANPYYIGDHKLLTSASIGIASFPLAATESATLIKNADVAMYQAKQAGRNTYRLFSEAMHKESRYRLQLAEELKNALETDQLTMHYQPKYNLHKNAFTDVEAFIRWEHPERGNISPREFIPVAEEAGIILSLGKWIAKNVCQHMEPVFAENLIQGAVSINFSNTQLIQGDLIPMLKDFLGHFHIDPRRLEIEITEEALTRHAPSSINAIHQLHEVGIKISLDNFGTGFSSLSLLKTLPLETLKIDRAFTLQVHSDPDDAGIVQAIIALGHSLNLNVLAEGVEKKEQMEFLKRVGCDKLQGYYFSKPLPQNELMVFLKKQLKHA